MVAKWKYESNIVLGTGDLLFKKNQVWIQKKTIEMMKMFWYTKYLHYVLDKALKLTNKNKKVQQLFSEA